MQAFHKASALPGGEIAQQELDTSGRQDQATQAPLGRRMQQDMYPATGVFDVNLAAANLEAMMPHGQRQGAQELPPRESHVPDDTLIHDDR